MFKYISIVMLISVLSDLTGVPVCPLSPVVRGNSIEFKVNSIDSSKWNKFQSFVKSKS